MDAVIAVVARTEGFARVWEELAASAGAVLRVGAAAADVAPLSEAAAVLVAVAGEEEAAPEAVEDARAAGAGDVAAVGAEPDHRLAVAVLQAGASNFFALPGDLEALRAWVAERVARLRERDRAQALAARERQEYDFSRMVGESEALRVALERAARVIPRTAATVLITGETGTGKELLAQAIHYNGPRAEQPFVEVNCTALPATLLEAELFGYERGAFTDARAAKPGLFEAAHGGTLLLDEIGDVPLELQVKLLKVLEDRQVRRLGSLRSTAVDVRIIAATHIDLPEAVREGSFREDLYYRLNVIPIHLPPLRERGDDVLRLADHFVARFAGDYDLPAPILGPGLRAALMAHPWRGNIRELRNAIERAVVLGEGQVRREDLFPGTIEAAGNGTLPFPASMDVIEEAAARAMLERCGGNKTAAADALGISRTRLYRLLEGGG